ncbi:uncharacterized protein LOC142364867 [Opisthocomus hoazin]|uniref:uncharacterized protein LOC142364867 n=1 Tax=Opisthocomus hoazin TaxID=30419 RepID=UPI003F53CECE
MDPAAGKAFGQTDRPPNVQPTLPTRREPIAPREHHAAGQGCGSPRPPRRAQLLRAGASLRFRALNEKETEGDSTQPLPRGPETSASSLGPEETRSASQSLPFGGEGLRGVAGDIARARSGGYGASRGAAVYGDANTNLRLPDRTGSDHTSASIRPSRSENTRTRHGEGLPGASRPQPNSQPPPHWGFLHPASQKPPRGQTRSAAAPPALHPPGTEPWIRPGDRRRPEPRHRTAAPRNAPPAAASPSPLVGVGAVPRRAAEGGSGTQPLTPCLHRAAVPAAPRRQGTAWGLSPAQPPLQAAHGAARTLPAPGKGRITGKSSRRLVCAHTGRATSSIRAGSFCQLGAAQKQRPRPLPGPTPAEQRRSQRPRSASSARSRCPWRAGGRGQRGTARPGTAPAPGLAHTGAAVPAPSPGRVSRLPLRALAAFPGTGGELRRGPRCEQKPGRLSSLELPRKPNYPHLKRRHKFQRLKPAGAAAFRTPPNRRRVLAAPPVLGNLRSVP